MKKILLLPSLLLTLSSFGQNKIDSLVQIGIQYHDKGEYDKAIEAYNSALKFDPKSTLVNYEIAMTYMYAGNYKKSIKHSDIIIKQKKEHLLLAYISKGSSLDNLGKTKQSIKLFNKAISEFGDNYLLLYNLGINYSKIKDYKNAESVFSRAIANNSNHPSSHYALALIENEQSQRVKSLLSLYYFLLIEPSSKRAEASYMMLKEQLGGSVQKDKNNPMNFNILVNKKSMDSEFGAAELMLAMTEASNTLEENNNKTPDELFIENTKSFFTVLGELNENEKKTNIWRDFYVPFFYKLAKSDYLDVFCYYISISSNEKASEWLNNNSEKLENFGEWLNEI